MCSAYMHYYCSIAIIIATSTSATAFFFEIVIGIEIRYRIDSRFENCKIRSKESSDPPSEEHSK